MELNQFFNNVIRFWWVLVLAGVLGGLTGFGVHLLLPPVYQAQASITVNIDYALTGELTDVEEDHMIIAVGELARSDEVVDGAVTAAADAGVQIDRVMFDSYASLQRSFTNWLFIVRHQDPETAARLSNFWADSARSVLTEAYQHAVKAGELQYLIEQLSCCSTDPTAEEIFSCTCNETEVSEMQRELDQISDEIGEERLASKGIAMGSLIAFNQRAQIPQTPAILGRNLLIFSGGLLGLVVSLILLILFSFRMRIKEEE